ncbi:TPA: hypothetical protein ACGU7P_004074 [Vibrio vulnificus]|nr:hypothetical protein [Vibrio vulnificus]
MGGSVFGNYSATGKWHSHGPTEGAFSPGTDTDWADKTGNKAFLSTGQDEGPLRGLYKATLQMRYLGETTTICENGMLKFKRFIFLGLLLISNSASSTKFTGYERVNFYSLAARENQAENKRSKFQVGL